MFALDVRWRRVAQILLGTGILQASNITIYIVLARLMPAQEYGSYRQLFLINQILFTIFFATFPIALLYFCGRATTEDEKKSIVKQFFFIVLVIALLISVTLLFMGPFAAWALKNDALKALVPLFFLFPGAFMISSLIPSMLVVYNRTNILPLITGAIAVINGTLIIVTAFLMKDVSSVIIAASAGGALSALISIFLIFYLSKDTPKSNLAFSEILTYIWPLIAAAAVSIIGVKLDQIVVSQIFGPSIFAIYIVGAFELPIYSLLKSSSSSVILPELSEYAQKNDWPRILEIWQDMLVKNATILFPISAFLFVFSEEFIVLLFGDNYREAAPVFSIFILLGPVRSVTFSLILRATGNTRFDLYASTAFLVVVSIAIYPAVLVAGLMGAALVVVLATTALAGLMLYMTKKASGGALNIRALYPVRIIVTYLLLILFFEVLHFTIEELDILIPSILICGLFVFIITFLLLRINKHLMHILN